MRGDIWDECGGFTGHYVALLRRESWRMGAAWGVIWSVVIAGIVVGWLRITGFWS